MPYYKDQNLTISYVSLNSATSILLSSEYGRDKELSLVLDLSTEYMTTKIDYFSIFQNFWIIRSE